MDLPTGIITFLFTDIEGSSHLWEKHPNTMRSALARHDRLLQDAVVNNQGNVVKMRGDGLQQSLQSVQDAAGGGSGRAIGAASRGVG